MLQADGDAYPSPSSPDYTPTSPDQPLEDEKEVKPEAEVKKEEETPGLLTVSDDERVEEEAVDSVFLHAATLSLSLDSLPTSVGHWHRIILQHYVGLHSGSILTRAVAEIFGCSWKRQEIT